VLKGRRSARSEKERPRLPLMMFNRKKKALRR